MPRRKHLRKVVEPPAFRSFRPTGNIPESLDPVELLYEEYEAIKLADYDGLHHHEACKKMGISRPTFARIYQVARNKIARALVEVREIKPVYGNVVFDKHWYFCKNCEASFSITHPDQSDVCPLCSSHLTEPIVK